MPKSITLADTGAPQEVQEAASAIIYGGGRYTFSGEINKIAPSLRAAGLVYPVDIFKTDPDNANIHPERNLEAIKVSWDKYGQRKPISAIRRNGEVYVMAGNGSLEAVKALGWTEIAAAIDDDLSPTDVIGYGLADNQTARLAKRNLEVEARHTKLLAEQDGFVAGWTTKDLALLRMRNDELLTNGSTTPNIFSDDAIVEAAYVYFRKTGFPYPFLPLHSCMQEINNLANTDPLSLPETNTGIAVADSYHRHRWAAPVEGKRTPMQTYTDDDLFRVAISKTLEIGGKIGKHFVEGLRYSKGTQACANFRPGFALQIYKRFGKKGGTLLDTSTGYGGRLVGFMASPLGRYIGIDPNAETCAANLRMVEELGFSDHVEIYESPAEDLGVKQFANQCDLAFSSPPYFRKEHYSDDETQSWKRYPDGESWRDGFLLPMMCLQFASLKPGSYAIINIADVEIGGEKYPLVEWTKMAAQAVGFTLENVEEYVLGRVPGAKGAETSSEPVLIFKKS